jgi:hypothetical protein
MRGYCLCQHHREYHWDFSGECNKCECTKYNPEDEHQKQFKQGTQKELNRKIDELIEEDEE